MSMGNLETWTTFAVVLVFFLGIDLALLVKNGGEPTTRESLAWTLVWIAVSLAFSGYVFATGGVQKGTEFLSAYLIEKALSVDNIFVFVVIFTAFRVEPMLQKRCLFWGVLGALLLRGSFIVAGLALIQQFHALLYLLGAFLVFTGVKVAFQAEEDPVEIEHHWAVKQFRRLIRMTPDYRGSRFVVREEGRLHATPLLMVLVVVETTDLIFALDSIPAVFAITQDPFLVFTSNIFAILGLRSIYFLLARAMRELEYLEIGLGLVLVFVGGKMLAARWIEISPVISLVAIAAVITIAVVASLLRPAEKEKEASEAPRE